MLTRDQRELDRIWVIPYSEQFTFYVEACKRAHLVLSTGEIDGYTYDIAIGDDGNRQTTLRKYQQVLQETPTPDILNCHEMRQFTLSWEDKTISLWGTYEGLILDHYIEDLEQITAVSMTTDDGATGTWEFHMYNGEYLILSMSMVSLEHSLCGTEVGIRFYSH